MSDPFTNPTTIEQGSASKVEPDRDRWGRYKMPTFNGSFDPATYGKIYGHQRVTTFAKMLADTYGLAQWKTRMALKGSSLRPDLYAQIAAANIEDSAKLNKLAELCQEAAGSSKGAGLGTALHAFTERYDLGEITPDQVPAPWDKDVLAYAEKIKEYGFEFPVEFIEVVLTNERHGLGGTADRIARLTRDIVVKLGTGRRIVLRAGTWVIVDVKSGRDLSYSMGDIAIQLGEYATADAGFDFGTKRFFPIPEMNREVGFVIHLPAGQAKAKVIPVDIAAGIAAAEHAVFTREWRKRKDLAGTCETVESSVEDIDESGQEFIPDVDDLRLLAAIGQAKDRQTLTKLWQDNKSRWGAELSEASKLRITELNLIDQARQAPTIKLLNAFEAANTDNHAWTDEVTQAVVDRHLQLIAPERLADLIKVARTTDALRELWLRNRRRWTPELSALATRRKAEITKARAAGIACSAAQRAESYSDPADRDEAVATALRAADVAVAAHKRAEAIDVHTACFVSGAPDDVMMDAERYVGVSVREAAAIEAIRSGDLRRASDYARD